MVLVQLTCQTSQLPMMCLKIQQCNAESKHQLRHTQCSWTIMTQAMMVRFLERSSPRAISGWVHNDDYFELMMRKAWTAFCIVGQKNASCVVPVQLSMEYMHARQCWEWKAGSLLNKSLHLRFQNDVSSVVILIILCVQLVFCCEMCKLFVSSIFFNFVTNRQLNMFCFSLLHNKMTLRYKSSYFLLLCQNL